MISTFVIPPFGRSCTKFPFVSLYIPLPFFSLLNKDVFVIGEEPPFGLENDPQLSLVYLVVTHDDLQDEFLSFGGLSPEV